MKTKIVIIEDNFYRYFATKNLLENQLKMKMSVVNIETPCEIPVQAKSLKPNMIVYRPNGSLVDLLTMMKKRGTNRRNSEITLILADEFNIDECRQVENFVEQYPKKSSQYAKAA